MSSILDKTRLEPTEIAPETYLIHNHQGEGTAPVAVALNSMIIRGQQPVVVDTGVPANREQYLTDVFSIVEPADVRWVFLSHDDIDHTGNVNELMAACPNATLVLNWFMVERIGETLETPPSRWRWVADGDALDVGDRVLHAVRPPIFDSPTTRGLYDPTTGVYWASDAFATGMPTPVPSVNELDREFWATGMAMFGQYISPWLSLVDDRLYQRTVDRIEALRPTVLAACHTPAITGGRVAEAIDIARRTPTMTVPAAPDQSLLEHIQRTFADLAA